MPDSPQGKRGVFDTELVEDAFEKASRAGAKYYFTWVVRDFALFLTHKEGVPFADRVVEERLGIAAVVTSDDVRNPLVEQRIRQFWEDMLCRLRDLDAGAPITTLPLDQRFIRRIEGSLAEPIDLTIAEAARMRDASDTFRTRLDAWMRDEQGWEISSDSMAIEENVTRAARLSCYSLLNRIVFYEVLRRQLGTLPPLASLNPPDVAMLREALERSFSMATAASRDYETIFKVAGIGAELPFLSGQSVPSWLRVIANVEEFDFSRLDYDVIGKMYEQLIGHGERSKYGQFYTSPEVVDLVNAFCIRNPRETVLDPACGGGTFLVRAYARKRALAEGRGLEMSHAELLSAIYAMDIGAFPAQLTTINLAVRHLSPEPNYPRVAQRDFFDGTSRPLAVFPAGGGVVEVDLPTGGLDAVVGNPPYIRQEEMSALSKQHSKSAAERGWQPPPDFTGRSDVYVYFFGKAGRLLREGGYLGFVTSVGWLDTEYGFRLQEFMLRNFRIVAVIESQVDKWFADARVTTCVTVLQRESAAEVRNANLVRFVQLRKPLAEIYSEALGGKPSPETEKARQGDMDTIRDLIEGASDDVVTDYWRIRLVSQRELWRQGVRRGAEYEAGKWGQYLRAPDVWFDISTAAGRRLVRLGDIATVLRGVTTGKDAFFCVEDVTDQEAARNPGSELSQKWGVDHSELATLRIVRSGDGSQHVVEARYLEPEVHTLMDASSPVMRAGEARKLVLNVQEPPSALAGTHVARYIRYGERKGWDRGATVAARSRSGQWYDLGLSPPADRARVLWPKGHQYRHLALLNPDQMPCKDRLYEVFPHHDVDEVLLWAVLNSTIVAVSKATFGRPAGIEGYLDTQVIDAEMMLVPDVRWANGPLRQRLQVAGENLGRRPASRNLWEEFDQPERQELDDAVLELLGVGDSAERISLRTRLYDEIRASQGATRDREIVAQRDRGRGKPSSKAQVAELADDIWAEVSESAQLLEFPRDFVRNPGRGDAFDLLPGPVQLGSAMLDTGRSLRIGTIRIGGPDGPVLDAGGRGRAAFMKYLIEAGHYGRVRVPDEAEALAAVEELQGYLQRLHEQLASTAAARTRDKARQKRIVEIAMRHLLSWVRDPNAATGGP